jgi:hypothetical protein
MLDAWQRVSDSEYLEETDRIWLRKSDKLGIFLKEFVLGECFI